MTFQERLRNVKTNVEETFLKRFCIGWDRTLYLLFRIMKQRVVKPPEFNFK